MKDVDPESVSEIKTANNGQGSARGGTNIFLEYIFEFLINTAPLASDSVYKQILGGKTWDIIIFLPLFFCNLLIFIWSFHFTEYT